MDQRSPSLPDALLAPLQALLNRNIQASTPARGLLPQLAGKVLAVSLKGTALALYMQFNDSGAELRFTATADPDVILTGGLFALARLTGEDASQALLSGDVDLLGEPELAKTIQALLQHAHPDWEEELSRLIGDVAAHQVGNFARSLFGWGQQAGESMQRNTAEYLQEESRDLVAPAEAREYFAGVDEARDGVERAAARLNRLEQRLNAERDT
ncbi:MAG: SCP2 sterol-binding domain-containing protein [Gammaproteobacteria bacterium]|nr:SCP2 sterol-binding domain-containing protein [Gammaproteobacteria bacterium]